MSMNETPVSERAHIAFFGCRNAGKSSLLNAVTGQKMAIVSDVKGTTTDPVFKTMELLPAGPVMIIDTPGLDDEGELGMQRVEKALQVLRRTDVAVLVVDSERGLSPEDDIILRQIKERNIRYLVAYNKNDIKAVTELKENEVSVSAVSGDGIDDLRLKIAELAKSEEPLFPLVHDLVNPGDVVLLVIPIDKAAPKGRLILPQQQTIRDLLDYGAIPVMTRDKELPETLKKFEGQVKLVITDSQAFKEVAAIVPDEIPLTSFSILFSRYKGEASVQLRGLKALRDVQDGDKIMIAEGCTHRRQCGDIGTEKIPNLLRKKTGKEVEISFFSGQEYPDDLEKYRMIIHCGGCMLNAREMKARITMAEDRGVPITNYGMILAYFSGILERSLRVFPQYHAMLEEE